MRRFACVSLACPSQVPKSYSNLGVGADNSDELFSPSGLYWGGELQNKTDVSVSATSA